MVNKRILLYFIAPLSLCGCSYFGYSKSPITTKSVGDVQVAAMEATHRAIIVSRSTDGNSYKYCAEPPPDAVSNITESISAAIKANAGKKDIEASVAAATALARSIDEIYSRSHAVQLFRDASFSLCQAHLIGLAKGVEDPNAAEKKREIDELQKKFDELGIRADKLNRDFKNAVRDINPEIDLIEDYFDEQVEINKLVAANPSLKNLRDIRDRAVQEAYIVERSLINKNDAYTPASTNDYYRMFSELLKITGEILQNEIEYITDSELVEAKTKLGMLQDNSVDIVKAMRAAGEFSTEQVNSIVALIESMTATSSTVEPPPECETDEALNEQNICEKKNTLKTGEGGEVQTDNESTTTCAEGQTKDADGQCSATETPDTASSEPLKDPPAACEEGKKRTEAGVCE